MDTSVSEENGALVLYGEKMWVNEGGKAEAAVVWARFPKGWDPSKTMDWALCIDHLVRRQAPRGPDWRCPRAVANPDRDTSL